MQIAQGDLLIESIDFLPKNVSKKEANNGQYILAHSETGHDHVISSETTDFYAANDDVFFSYLKVKKESQIIHLRSFDTHKPINLNPGMYKITRQREYIPQGYRRVED